MLFIMRVSFLSLGDLELSYEVNFLCAEEMKSIAFLGPTGLLRALSCS